MRGGGPRPSSLAHRLLDPLVKGQSSSSLRRSFVAGTAGTLILNVGALVWSFGGIVLLGRVLGAKAYGGYVYALGWSALLGVPALLGIPQLLVREVASYEARGEPWFTRGAIRRSFQATLAASMTVVILTLPGALVVARGEPAVQRAFAIGLLLIPIVAVYRVSESLMRGFRRVSEGRLAETTVQPLAIIVLVLLARLLLGRGIGPDAAMALTVAAGALAAGASLLLLPRSTPQSVRDASPQYQHRRWVQGLRPLFVFSVAAIVQPQIVLVLVGALDDVKAGGVFSAAFRWAGFVSFLQVVAVSPLAPALARLHASGDKARLQRLLSTTAAVVAAAGLPVALVLVVFSRQALQIFGDAFTEGTRALVILVVGELVNVATGSVAIALIATGHERTVAWVTATAVAVTAALCLVLIPRYGLEGAAIARSVGVAALNVVLVWRLWHHERIYAAVIGRRLVTRLSAGRAVPSR